MTQFSQPQGYPQQFQQQRQGYPPPAAPRSNPLAIVSLVCGIIGCFVITAVAGLITGVIAFAIGGRSGGRGMAIAGIILSALWLAGIVGGGYFGYQKLVVFVGEQAKPPTMAFVNDLADGDTKSASIQSSMTQGELEKLSDQIKPLGKLKDIKITQPNYTNNNGVITINFVGTGTFEKGGPKKISATLVGGGGTLKLSAFNVE
jgi:hypothetical protein